MEFTYERVVNWLDDYFKAFNKNAGPLETARNMREYFTPDLEFWAYNKSATERRPLSRDLLLMTMIHPGLHEEITPREYVVDVRRMVVVVQFQLQFTDEPSGTKWPAKQASAHYHFVLDNNKELKIKKILYFMEAAPTSAEMYDLWRKYKDNALEDLARSWLQSPHKTLDEINARPEAAG